MRANQRSVKNNINSTDYSFQKQQDDPREARLHLRRSRQHYLKPLEAYSWNRNPSKE